MDTQFYVNMALGGGLLLAFALAVFALIEVKAMQRSTHQVTYIDPFAGLDKETDNGGVAATGGGGGIPPLSDKDREELSKKPEAYDNLT